MIQVLREKHDTPKWAEDELKRLGTNIFGEGLYRLIWGWSRLSWIGGKFEDISGQDKTVEFEMRFAPKYTAQDRNGRLTFDRWFLEKWMSPETYGPIQHWYDSTIEWEDEIHKSGRYLFQLGPFPSRGEYELSYVLETSQHDYLAPTPEIIRYLIHSIEVSRLIPKSKRKAALYEREEKKQKAEIARNEDILSDVSPFFRGSYTVVPEVKNGSNSG